MAKKNQKQKYSGNAVLGFIKSHKELATFIARTAIILVFSALIVTLSLAFNELFVEIKEKYIESHKGKIIACVIYIVILVSIIVGGLLALRLVHINIDVSSLIG